MDENVKNFLFGIGFDGNISFLGKILMAKMSKKIPFLEKFPQSKFPFWESFSWSEFPFWEIFQQLKCQKFPFLENFPRLGFPFWKIF